MRSYKKRLNKLDSMQRVNQLTDDLDWLMMQPSKPTTPESKAEFHKLLCQAVDHY